MAILSGLLLCATVVGGESREQAQAEADTDKFQSYAERAAAAGSEEDVREALSQRSMADERRSTLIAEIERNNQLVAQLRSQVNTARAKVAGAESNLVRLNALMQAIGAKPAASQVEKIRTTLAGQPVFGDGGTRAGA